jgi:uncharacterized protein YaaQ
MKLVMAIIHDEDAYGAIDLLTESRFSVTKLASTGGFLRSGNTTLIVGVDDDRVDEVTALIEKTCKSRNQVTTANAAHLSMVEGFVPFPIEVTLGGATIFVLNVEEFKKV